MIFCSFCRRFNEFKCCRKDTNDAERSGSQTLINIYDIILNNRQEKVRQIAAIVKILIQLAHNILSICVYENCVRSGSRVYLQSTENTKVFVESNVWMCLSAMSKDFSCDS